MTPETPGPPPELAECMPPGVRPETPDQIDQRLSAITTVWSMIKKSQQTGQPDALAAQQEMIDRYGGAVYRYLQKAVPETSSADDLTQEFALSIVRGDFKHADPERGRFRDYIKTVLFHLVAKHRKKQHNLPRPLPPDSPELADLAAPAMDPDSEFNESWRDELLSRTWDALQRAQETYYTVLRLKVANPDMNSSQLAQRLSQMLFKSYTADAVRQALHRARNLYAELLLEEVAHSLVHPTTERLEDELRELDLLAFCRPALERLAAMKQASG